MEQQHTDISPPPVVGWKKRALAVSEGFAGVHEPVEVWEATTEDGGALEALLWGSGTPEAPYEMLVRHRARIRAEGNRYPSWEESYRVLGKAAKPGALFVSEAILVSPTPEPFEESLTDLWVGITYKQVGALKNTPAAGSGLIFLAGDAT